MKLTDEWFTALSQDGEGKLIFVTGRKSLEGFRAKGSLKVRVEIKWPYPADREGMPDERTAKLITEIEPRLRQAMECDKLAILTGNYTGSGEKYWVFYTRHLPTFGERLNAALADYETLPLEILCEEDPEWEEYLDMLSMEREEHDE
ncbi:MAG: DUF695 domain-containing protein [Porphyromonadaceae bacterium]|nr:DUF695 domain-containing protein [Porphyromonadaceae bacterium]